ncbi:MAG TPA: hypothetical protein VD866_10855 [Urbifossiella sp.]|nr:hypothetical protein [Urbifossiella sp.]
MATAVSHYRSDGDLDRSVAAVAALRDEGAVREAARRFPGAYGPEVVPELARRFNDMIEPPPGFAAREPSATAWIGRWQYALVEILGQYREHALPVLRERAGAGYHDALVMLCRLAAAGIERPALVAELRDRLADLPPAALEGVGDALIDLARTDPAVAGLVEELREEPAFGRALAEAGDGWAGIPGGGPERTGGAVARQLVWAGVVLAAGVGAGLGVVDATGAWGAVLVGSLAGGFTAAVLLLAEATVLRRM